MTWITMKETRRGCEDGFTIRRFEKDASYDVADSLARQFVGNGWAIPAKPAKSLDQITAELIADLRRQRSGYAA